MLNLVKYMLNSVSRCSLLSLITSSNFYLKSIGKTMRWVRKNYFECFIDKSIFTSPELKKWFVE